MWTSGQGSEANLNWSPDQTPVSESSIWTKKAQRSGWRLDNQTENGRLWRTKGPESWLDSNPPVSMLKSTQKVGSGQLSGQETPSVFDSKISSRPSPLETSRNLPLHRRRLVNLVSCPGFTGSRPWLWCVQAGAPRSQSDEHDETPAFPPGFRFLSDLVPEASRRTGTTDLPALHEDP